MAINLLLEKISPCVTFTKHSKHPCSVAVVLWYQWSAISWYLYAHIKLQQINLVELGPIFFIHGTFIWWIASCSRLIILKNRFFSLTYFHPIILLFRLQSTFFCNNINTRDVFLLTKPKPDFWSYNLGQKPWDNFDPFCFPLPFAMLL